MSDDSVDSIIPKLDTVCLKKRAFVLVEKRAVVFLGPAGETADAAPRFSELLDHLLRRAPLEMLGTEPGI